jgi:hypothetical protein
LEKPLGVAARNIIEKRKVVQSGAVFCSNIKDVGSKKKNRAFDPVFPVLLRDLDSNQEPSPYT